MARSIFLALLASIGIHLVLAVGLIVCLDYAPGTEAVATLDLTSVELSFAEKIEETAAVTPVPPASSPEPPKPKSAEKPPEQKIEKMAPDPLASKFPEPKEEKPELITHHASLVTPQLAAPRQARIDAPPSPTRTIRPDYPTGARQRGEQGAVVLEIHVDAEGTVSEAKVAVSSGFAELDEAAVRAAEKAKFRPAKSGGKSVASTARLKLDFKLK